MSCADWPPPLPLGVRVERAGAWRLENLSRLPAAQKQARWAELRIERPALAALLRDPQLQALRAAFNAEVYIDVY